MLAVANASVARYALAPMTVRPAIRVRPVVSADAVAAVRRGLRRAFWPASVPQTPNRRSTGPAAAMTGRDSSGVRTNTPVSSATAPRASHALPSTIVVAVTTRTNPPAASTEPMVSRTTRLRAVAGAYPLLIAATGGIRAAYRAGTQVARTVTPTPMTRAAMTVAAPTTSGPSGSVRSVAYRMPRTPAPTPTPIARPATEATRPTVAASASTEKVTCRRLAPTARSSANSLVRWATSMLNVLTIRKTATKSAIPAQASSTWPSARTLPALTSACSAASCAAVTASVPSGNTVSARPRSGSADVPGAAFRSIWLYRPGFANRRWAVAVSKRVRVPPAATFPSSVAKMPLTVCSMTGPLTDTRTVSPTP
jgi:hypothetical protein